MARQATEVLTHRAPQQEQAAAVVVYAAVARQMEGRSKITCLVPGIRSKLYFNITESSNYKIEY